MQVSVVIPTYNGARFLAKTVESVRAQTLTDWELVIVDAGSTDDTPKLARSIAEQDARIRLLQQKHGTVAAMRNVGLEAISPDAPYITFLNHDELWKPDALPLLIGALERDPDLTAAHSMAAFIDEEGRPSAPGEAERLTKDREACVDGQIVSWAPNLPTTLAVQALHNPIYTPGQVVIRRSALKQAGPFDLAVSPADDYDLWLRLCILGDMAYVDQVLLRCRRRAENMTHQMGRMVQQEIAVRRKRIGAPGLTQEQRDVLTAGRRLWYRRTARQWAHWALESLKDREFDRAAQLGRHALHDYWETIRPTKRAANSQ